MRSSIRGSHVRAASALVATLVVGGCTMDITAEDIEAGLCSGPNPSVVSVGVQPREVNLRLGFNVRLQATPMDAQGQLVFCAPTMTWSSSNPAIATVSEGLVVGVSAGKAFIRASSGGKADSAAVTIVATTIGSVVIERVPTMLLIGQTAGLKLVARDTDGNVITPLSITWRTEDAAVATVSTTGMVVAVSEGTATVTAVAEGLTATARIPVTRDPPARRFRQIAAGFQHTCAIVGGGGVPEGTAFCWGDGSVGQVGVGATGFASVPLPVSGGRVFASIAAGNNSSCAVTASGEAYCWGKNDSGQLGDGTKLDRTVPVRVATTLAFRQLASGGSVTCGLTSEGAAYCWGLVGSVSVVTPTPVPGGIQFAELTGGGGGFVCGRTGAGRAYCWGSGDTWFASTPTAVRGDLLFSQISAGPYHVCGVAISDGRGYCWGRMDSRPLGPSISAGTRETPVAMPGGLGFTLVSAGGGFTCGAGPSGSFCLGGSYLANSEGASSPVPIPMKDRPPFVSISSGWFHSCAIDANGGGWCWGRNFEGQVGAGERTSPATEPLQLRIA